MVLLERSSTQKLKVEERLVEEGNFAVDEYIKRLQAHM